MAKRRWPVVMVAIGGVLGGSFATGAGAMGDGSPLQVGLGVASGVLGDGVAAAQAGATVRAARRAPTSPLAYAVTAGRLEPRGPRWVDRSS